MSPRKLLAAAAFTIALVVAGACSKSNREGPDVTCEDLACGRINACQDGIIAQCVDGIVLRFQVCNDATICERDWQVPGEYTCDGEDTDCEGCRPERIEGCNWIDPLAAGGGGTGGTGGTGGAGGFAEGGGDVEG